MKIYNYIGGLVQNCGDSSASAMELLQGDVVTNCPLRNVVIILKV